MTRPTLSRPLWAGLLAVALSGCASTQVGGGGVPGMARVDEPVPVEIGRAHV